MDVIIASSRYLVRTCYTLQKPKKEADPLGSASLYSRNEVD